MKLEQIAAALGHVDVPWTKKQLLAVRRLIARVRDESARQHDRAGED